MSNDKQTIIKTNKKDDINIIKDIYYILKCKTPPMTTRPIPIPTDGPKKVKRRDFWYGEEGMCEICNTREATKNLDLSCGSHR